MLGLQQMSGLTMYANLKHWGGSNHLLLPTNLLAETDWLPEAASRAKLPLLSALLAIFGRAQGQVGAEIRAEIGRDKSSASKSQDMWRLFTVRAVNRWCGWMRPTRACCVNCPPRGACACSCGRRFLTRGALWTGRLPTRRRCCPRTRSL